MDSILKKKDKVLSEDMKKAVQEAEIYITNTLRLDKSKMTQEEISNRKRELAKKIRLVIASEFGVPPSSIRLAIRDDKRMSKSLACWRKNQGDEKAGVYGDIVYNKKFFERSSFESFIKITTHEFGHVGQSLANDRGEDVSTGLSIISRSFSDIENAQIDIRHTANTGEFNADMFAYGKTAKWIIEARKKGIGGNKKALNQLYGVADNAGSRALSFVLSKAVLMGCGFIDSVTDIAKPYRMGFVLNPSDMYKRNVKNEKNGYRSLAEAEKYLKDAYGKNHLSEAEKLRVADSMSVVLAGEIGIEPRDIGTVVLPQEANGIGYSNKTTGNGGANKKTEKAVKGYVFIGGETLKLDGKEYMEQLRDHYKSIEGKIKECPQSNVVMVGELGKDENQDSRPRDIKLVTTMEYL